MTGGGAAGETAFERAGPGHADLLVEMMREFYALEHLAWDEAAVRHGLSLLLCDDGPGEVWLARRGGAPAGYFVLTLCFSLEFGGAYLLLDELYLREAHRGSGLGRRAMMRAEAVCRARGIAALRLEVDRRNTGARAFYRTLGFEDHERDLLTKRVPAAPVGAAGP